MSEPQPRKPFLERLRPRSKRPPIEDSAEADHQLDLALERLSRSMDENEVVGDRVKRRQSSGSLKIVVIPAPEQ